MAQVVAGFLGALGGDGSQLRVLRILQRAPYLVHQCRVQKVAHDGDGVVPLGGHAGREGRAVRQFDQHVITKLRGFAQIGQRVFRVAFFHQRRGMLVQQPRLPNQIQTNIRQRNVLLQHRAVPTPLGVALSEDQRVVRQMQQVIDRRMHHMCPTSSGMA